MSSDAQLADGLARDPAGGLAAVYQAYSARLYTYALTMLRDPAGAQDVVHDALLVASGSIGQLRDPAKLRPWLYAITRNECLRALRGRNRFSDADEVIDVPDDSIDFDAGLRREEASRLIAQGMAVMNPADRDILSLALQHDLDVERISQITGAKPNALHARLSRARAGLSDAISALALYRTRGRDCSELAAIVADQPLSPLLRKRIARHIKECADCERRRRGALAALGPAMAAPVFIPPPADLLSRIQQSLHQGQAAPLAQAAVFDADGFPRPLDARRSHTWLLPVAAVIAVLLLVAVGLVVTGDRSTKASTDSGTIMGSAAASPQASSTSSPSVEAPAAVEPDADIAQPKTPVEEPTVATVAPSEQPTVRSTEQSAEEKDTGTRSTKPKKTATPKPTVAPTAAAPPQATPAAQAPVITGVTLVDLDKAADGGFTRCDGFTLQVTAAVSGSVDTVRAVIAPLGSAITLAGNPHEGTATLPPGDYTVSVEATGPGGTTTRDAGSVLHICPG
jgi:RNA polymerase sigma factor (sigma-70 family)